MEIRLKEANAGNPDCSRFQDAGNSLRMDAAESEHRNFNGRTNTREGMKAHRLAVAHFGRGGENWSQQEIVGASLRSLPGLTQGVRRYSEEKATGPMGCNVDGSEAGGRQMNPMCPCSERDVDPPVYQDPAGSISGEFDRFPGQVEKHPAGQIFFTKLNEIRPPGRCPFHLQKKRLDGRVWQLMAIGDVIKERLPNGQ